jgi:hypothetical protein
MSDDDLETRPDLNTGEPWSESQLLDLANSLRLGDDIPEIAAFLCRSRREIREKIAELEQKGELAKLMIRTAQETKGYSRPPRRSKPTQRC